jgi:hypothetical protein
MRTVAKDHLNYKAVISELQTLAKVDTHGYGEIFRTRVAETLRDLIDIPTFVAKVTEGRVRIGDNGVMFDDDVVEGVIAQRLMDILQASMNPRPLARFLQRLKANPTPTAIDEMYLWLESGKLPITDDGCFIAWKLVEEDFASGHRNPDGSKLFNLPGTVVEMDRELVDTRRDVTCSTGLHFCSWDYLPNFGFSRDTTRVVALKIAPEDVVSIPSDYDNTKGRAWRYLVLREVPKDECKDIFASRPVVTSFGVYDGEEDVEMDDYDDAADSDWVDVEEDCECMDHCMGTDPECPLLDGTPIDDAYGDEPCCDGVDGTADRDEPTFTHGKATFTAEQVRQNVSDYGQRGWSAMTGIPRTTIQEWLKRIPD